MKKATTHRRPSSENSPLRLGERLLRDGLISPDQVQIALHEQRHSKDRLGSVLVRLGFLSDDQLADRLAAHTGKKLIDLKTVDIDPDAMRRVPRPVAERCRVAPVSFDGEVLHLAIADPMDIRAMDEVRRYFPRQIEIIPLVASETDIAEALETYAQDAAGFNSILDELQGASLSAQAVNESAQHPLIRLVDHILIDAVRAGASDIHWEPESSFVRVRVRIDGVLRQKHALHRSHWQEISNRLKIMAKLNIADTRSMQDGRFHKQVNGADIDFRIAIMPTVQGENIVIRILDHRRALLPLEELGYDTQALRQMQDILERPEGIVLVTGPTGSGKTTTLYAMLKRLSDVSVNIMTLEEPVEYQFEMIRQTAIQENQGMTFGEGVRGILRQAPDIIFVGEIRDDDTARMALRAAMTGHQVFSTLHCNDSFGALPRLNDLGLSSRMMAENISGIIAQRLVRKLCAHCKSIRTATPEEEDRLNQAAPVALTAIGFAEAQSALGMPPRIAEAKGCPHCDHTGYRGRLAITEILRVSPMLDELIAADVPRAALRKQAAKEGFRPMSTDGIAKVLRFETSLDELRRTIDMTRRC